MIVILIGIIVAVEGFAFAFSGVNSEYIPYVSSYGWLGVFPNLISGIILGIGGIVIAITGNVYYRKKIDRSIDRSLVRFHVKFSLIRKVKSYSGNSCFFFISQIFR